MSEAAGHREIDHTADLGFDVWAPDLPGLFAEATRGLAELCFDRAAVRPRESRPLRVRGRDREELLVRWLQEVYLQLETDSWLAADAEAMHVEGDEARGVLLGELLEPGRHVIHTEIKAITYHELRVARDASGGWRARVIVDV